MRCPKCAGEEIVKNGSVRKVSKRKCKSCGYQFTRTTPRGKPLGLKSLAIALYVGGLSLTRIGRVCGVSAQSALNWARRYGVERVEKPTPGDEIVVLELDDMWRRLKDTAACSGAGGLWVAQPVDAWIGSAETAIAKFRGEASKD